MAIRPSATLIVLAPIPSNKLTTGGSNYRVLMMKRNAKSSFINAHVFPGGVVDPQDAASLWQTTFKGRQQQQDDRLTSKICAIRETFEESGLLLTDPPSYTAQGLNHEEWRQRVHGDALQFKAMCDKFKLTPAIDRLVPFASWITPVGEKKRYNTQFYLTVLGQTVENEHKETKSLAADGQETVELEWLKPEQALDLWTNDEKIILFPPQWYCLHALKQIPDHRDVIAQAGIDYLRTRQGMPVTTRPQFHPADKSDPMVEKGYQSFLAYPGDETYEDDIHNIVSKPGQRHRIYFRGRMRDFHLVKNIALTDIVHSQPRL
ncbi:uncharacterized protein BYT42DRAFT_575519 [Radiomyces spectabilis]|uniref:uncharacterized protein n=1 Tax=Radiomyces spectabilis TaxID=64574 RepID=UPI002221013B|nr:uncharacterized protein BYT42DRAFT_575519 [Radiomyces spectabilis]KAI8374224.1 hypothetical protein BYT42DRAFT_575519 [Radiomyces spectabilis]